MGGGWSSIIGAPAKPEALPNAINDGAIVPPSATKTPSEPQQSQSTRKRRHPPDSGHDLRDGHDKNNGDTKGGIAINEKFPEKLEKTCTDDINKSDIDSTPDGETYRFKVSSGELYWAMRKDVLKFIRKLPEPLPPYTGLQKRVKVDHFFISFPNAQCAEKGKSLLDGRTFRKQEVSVERVARQPFKRQRLSNLLDEKVVSTDETNGQTKNNDTARSEDDTGNINDRTSLMAYPSAADVTAPWRDLTYEEQVKRKLNKLNNVLRDVTRDLRREIKHIDGLPWLSSLISKRENGKQPLCCPLVAFLTAKDEIGIRHHYRNKNEFTIGRPPLIEDEENKNKTSADAVIGYSLGLMRRGQFCVGAVDENCKTTSKLAIDVARALTPVVRASGLEPYDRFAHTGYWRQVTVRESVKSGQALVTMAVNPKYFETEGKAEGSCQSDSQCREAVVSALKELFKPRHKHAVRGGDDAVGIFWQKSTDLSFVSPETPSEHLYGLLALEETLELVEVKVIPSSTTGSLSTSVVKPSGEGQLDTDAFEKLTLPKMQIAQGPQLKFRIQQGSFFQVNTRMADVLYGLIGECASLTGETTLLDLCCGTGTIGISLARRVRNVVGIEISKVAIVDAKHNAELNGVKNTEFLVGSVETQLQEALKMIDTRRPCVVVLDPPRAGVSTSVISAIRRVPHINRVIYVACEPKNFSRNALGFCRPTSKAFRLEPFQPTRAYGVDLFPFTAHVEMVVVLERILDYQPRPKFSRKEGEGDDDAQGGNDDGEEQNGHGTGGEIDTEMDDIGNASDTKGKDIRTVEPKEGDMKGQSINPKDTASAG